MIKDQSKIDTFDLCADLFLYPDSEFVDRISRLKILNPSHEISLPNISLDEFESIYIKFFDINSKQNATTPLASYWLDGRAMGQSVAEIENFYKRCGFMTDNIVSDHISSMFAFCAILLENEKFDEFYKFGKYLSWLKEFDKGLQKMPIKIFSQIINLCMFNLERS